MSRQFAGWSGVRRKLGKKEVRRECVRGSRKLGVLYTNADFYCNLSSDPKQEGPAKLPWVGNKPRSPTPLACCGSI